MPFLVEGKLALPMLAHVPAGVDVVGLAGDGFVFSQEGGNLGYFFGGPYGFWGDFIADLFWDAGGHVGVDQAGGYSVGGDAILGKQGGVGAGQAQDAGFGGGVVGADDAAGLGGDGGQVDDAAPSRFTHVGQDPLGDQEHRGEIDAEEMFEDF